MTMRLRMPRNLKLARLTSLAENVKTVLETCFFTEVRLGRKTEENKRH